MGRPLFGLATATPAGLTADQAIAAQETSVGRTYDFIHQYHLWDTTFPAAYENTRSASQAILFSWQTRTNGGVEILYTDILSGVHNTLIDAQANRIKAMAGTVYLNVLGNEPELAFASGVTWTTASTNVHGTAAQFADAFRYIVGRFRALGVTNVQFTCVWAGIISTNRQAQVAAMYPGDAYVDWVAWDPYNRPTTNATASLTFAQMVQPFYAWFTTTVSGTKPLMLGEFGTEEVAGQPTAKADWFTGMLATIKAGTYPLLRAFCYFNHNRSTEGTGISGEFGLDTSTASRTAWNTAVNTVWPTVQMARLAVTSTAVVTTVQMSRLQVKATTAATVQMSRLEVTTAGLAGRWIMIGGVLVPLVAAGYPRDAVVTPPVTPPPSGAYVPPSYGPLGSYVPGSGTAGVIRPRTTTLSGNRTITATAEYRDVVFAGAVTVDPVLAPNSIFRNCEFQGGAPLSGGNFCITGKGNDFGNALFEDCLIKPSPANETQYMNGVYGTGYTMRRCEITRSVDGVSIVSGGTANNTLIEGCWIHNTSWISPASTQADNQTHNDGIQFHSQGQGSNITIRYNKIGGLKVQAGATQTSAEHAASDDCNNSCFMIQQEVSSASTVQINNVDVYGNTLQGGAARMNIAFKNANNLAGVRIGPNDFIRSTWAGGGGYYILRMTAATPAIDTAHQLFTDTGLPVPIQVI